MTWRGSYYTEVTLDHFLLELWPFVSFSHFINRSSCLRNSSYSFQGILMQLSSYSFHDQKMVISRSCSADFYQLWPFNNFSIVSLVSAILLQFLMDFYDTFQLLFPWPEEDHIKSRSHLIAFYQSYGPLPFIIIEKPCQHNILITTWARILIFGIWLRINVYMILLTFEKFHERLSELCPCYDFANTNRKILSIRYLENSLS